jgi:hypothetical protein
MRQPTSGPPTPLRVLCWMLPQYQRQAGQSAIVQYQHRTRGHPAWRLRCAVWRGLPNRWRRTSCRSLGSDQWRTAASAFFRGPCHLTNPLARPCVPRRKYFLHFSSAHWDSSHFRAPFPARASCLSHARRREQMVREARAKAIHSPRLCGAMTCFTRASYDITSQLRGAVISDASPAAFWS